MAFAQVAGKGVHQFWVPRGSLVLRSFACKKKKNVPRGLLLTRYLSRRKWTSHTHTNTQPANHATWNKPPSRRLSTRRQAVNGDLSELRPTAIQPASYESARVALGVVFEKSKGGKTNAPNQTSAAAARSTLSPTELYHRSAVRGETFPANFFRGKRWERVADGASRSRPEHVQ